MARIIVKGVGCAVVCGAVVAILGVWHRSSVTLGPVAAFPLGLILAVIGVFGCALAARALAGWAGVFGAAVGAFAVSQVSALSGPGGDLLIQGDWLGFAWAAAAPLVVMAVAFLPRRWFSRP
ncbi:MAG: hypothetical protein LBS27_01530 [Bifidobacteriaceae bacterium]|jgi:hypothetical protein|nr:hypothetical protein [Bifidobacteriaceae bacterium]